MENMREIFLLSQQITQRSSGQRSQLSQHLPLTANVNPSIPHIDSNSASSTSMNGTKGVTVNQWSKKWQQKKTTVDYLMSIIDSQAINFNYFVTLSFKSPVRDIGMAGKNNQWIKKLIVDYFYTKTGKTKADRMKFLFINERHRDGDIHLHLFMERWNDRCLDRVYSRIIQHTAFSCVDDLTDNAILNGLKKHLQKNVKTLGTGSASMDIRYVGDVRKRLEYVNKSIVNGCFEGAYDHIDFINSDIVGE